MHPAGNMKLRAGKNSFLFQGLAYLRVVIHTLYVWEKKAILLFPNQTDQAFGELDVL